MAGAYEDPTLETALSEPEKKLNRNFKSLSVRMDDKEKQFCVLVAEDDLF